MAMHGGSMGGPSGARGQNIYYSALLLQSNQFPKQII